MANTKNKQSKLRREPQKQEPSALDAAIAAAISAPPLSKKASQYQNSKKTKPAMNIIQNVSSLRQILR